MKSLVLFNNKVGVGKTTLTFNIAHMAARQGFRTIALDFDPQCNLSSIFLSEEQLVELWEQSGPSGRTVAASLDPVRRGRGDLVDPVPMAIADNLWLLPGHLALSRFEQALAEEWPRTDAPDNERALNVTTALDRLSNRAAAAVDADLVLLDLGPSLGALNRAALLACDAVAFPLAPDLFSLQGLKNVGPTLREWRKDWQTVRQRITQNHLDVAAPPHDFAPIGYIVQQQLARVDRPVVGYARWASEIPEVFHEFILEAPGVSVADFAQDIYCLGQLKHFASLVPLARLARKPLFDLKMADGVQGGQVQSVLRSGQELERLVQKITSRVGLVHDKVA